MFDVSDLSRWDSLICQSDTQSQLLVSLFESQLLSASLGSTVFYYDNGASVSICSDSSLLDGLVPLPVPQALGGVGSGVTITHRGYLKFLPNHLALCYYASDACANLISLGYIQEQGGMFGSIGVSQLLVADRGGVQIDLVTKGSNRLSTVSPAVVSSVWSADARVAPSVWLPMMRVEVPVSPSPVATFLSSLRPADPPVVLPSDHVRLCPCTHYPFQYAPPALSDDQLLQLLACPSQDWVILDSASTVLHAFPSRTSPSERLPHYTVEQRARCDRAQVVHGFIHINDDTLCHALDGGSYAWANITSADVRLNRRLRGPCIQCLEAKMEQKSMLPSHTPPAACVGAMISIDTNELTVPSVGGNIAYLDSLDEFSGDRRITPCKSLSSRDIFAAIMHLVHTRYNAYGHKVTHIMADSLRAFLAVVPMLGALGIVMTLVTPGQHAQRVERSVVASAGWRRAILASLPYLLPPKYELYLYLWIADVSGGLPNVHSHPSIPDIIVTGHRRTDHYKHPDLRFGQTVMTRVLPDKRAHLAHQQSVSPKDVPRSELGVCMGYSRFHPGSYDFLLANGEVVPRAVLEIVNVLPFGWEPHHVHQAILRPSVVNVISSASPSISQVSIQDDDTAEFPPTFETILNSAPVVVPPIASTPASVPVVHGPVLSSSRIRVLDSVSLVPPVVVPVATAPMFLPAPPVVPIVAPVVVSASGSRTTRSGRSIVPYSKHDPKPGSFYLANVDVSAELTFDTQRPDEMDLDQALLFCSSPAQLVAPLVSSSSLLPIPSMKGKEEPLSSALRTRGADRLVVPIATELDKQFRLGALGVDCDRHSLPADAIIVRAHVLLKVKSDGRDTARIAAQGDRLDPLPSEDTFAAVVGDGPKTLAIAAMQAHCASRSEVLMVSDADVVGGFLHIPLKSIRPMYLLLLANLPHRLAGHYVLILHALYGFRESNQLFGAEMSRVLTDVAGFSPTHGDPQLFVKSHHSDSGRRCVASLTVDDVLILTNDASLRQCLIDALTARFGPLTFNLVTAVHTGIEFHYLASGGILLTQDTAIARTASVVGVSHLLPVSMPYNAEFFLDCVGDEVVPVDISRYSSLMGKIVQFCKTRHEIRLLVSYLCTFNTAPLEGHYRRAIHLLRYLMSTPGVGCVFCADSVELVVHTDAAFAIFREGLSSTANLFCIGPSNAPFAASARSQSEVATCPMTAEYYAAGAACKDIVFYRQLLHDLGWSPASPYCSVRGQQDYGVFSHCTCS